MAIQYEFSILRLRSVPDDPSMLRDIFWRLSATNGTYSAQMEGSFTLKTPVVLGGLNKARIIGLIEDEIRGTDIERDREGRSTQPDGFDGNALELYRHWLANDIAAQAKPKPVEIEIPQ